MTKAQAILNWHDRLYLILETQQQNTLSCSQAVIFSLQSGCRDGASQTKALYFIHKNSFHSIWLHPPTDLLNFLSCSAFPSSQLKTTVLSVPSSAITPSFSGSTCTNSDGAASYYQCLLYFLLKDTTLQSGVLPNPPNCKQHSQSGSSFENFHVSSVKQLSQKYCQARGIILNATELSSWHKAPRSDLIHVFKSISGCLFPFMMVSHIPPGLQHTVRT